MSSAGHTSLPAGGPEGAEDAGTAPPAAAPRLADIGVLPYADAAQVDPDAPIPVPDDVRLVGTDLDGTLLDAALQVGAIARGAIPGLVSADIPIVYVTGRPPRWLAPVTEQTGGTGFAVCANGALVVDLTAKRLVRATTMDGDLVAAVVEQLRAAVPGITFAVERLAAGAEELDLAALTEFGMEDSYKPLWGRPPEAEIGDVFSLILRGPVLKLLAIPPDDSGHDNDSLVELALGHDQVHVTHSGARHALIEVTAAGADKGVGFLEVAGLLGVDPRHTVAAGDMPNDVPLIRAAGTGYAVANAHPLVRAAADHVLPSNVDDGVGRLLRAILAARTGRAMS